MTSIDIFWRQFTDIDFKRVNRIWLTSIDDKWRQLTSIDAGNIDGIVNFCQLSSIFVNNFFPFLKILKIVRNCQKLSKIVKKRHGRQKTSYLTRHVNWRQLTSITTPKWLLTSCWRSSIRVKKRQLTSIWLLRYQFYIKFSF